MDAVYTACMQGKRFAGRWTLYCQTICICSRQLSQRQQALTAPYIDIYVDIYVDTHDREKLVAKASKMPTLITSKYHRQHKRLYKRRMIKTWTSWSHRKHNAISNT